MKEKPILFSTPMVQAILNGTKTETRRVISKHEIEPYDTWNDGVSMCIDEGKAAIRVDDGTRIIKCPYGKPGDVLWVRETWCQILREHAHDLLEGVKENRLIVFKTEFHEDWIIYAKEKYGYKWKPSIHMPKAAARIWLQVEEIKVERLKDITEASAIAEGIEISKNGLWRNYIRPDVPRLSAVDSYMTLIGSIITMDKVFTNPWVWVVKFKVLSTTGKPSNI